MDNILDLKHSKYIFQSQYSLIQTLSKSSQNATFLVQKISSKQYFICKYYKTINMSAKQIDSILKQIQIISTIENRNIIKQFWHFQSDEQIAVILQYCEEGDLKFHIKQQQKKGVPFKKQVIEQWLCQMVMVLDYLHSNKIVHDFIGPDNVFLTSKGNIKVRMVVVKVKINIIQESNSIPQNLDRSDHNRAYYASPEAIEMKKLGAKTDIWCLGVLLYQLCSFKYPFEAQNIMSLALKIVKSEPEDIPSCYSSFLPMVIKLCLKKQPQKRPTAFQIMKLPYFINIMKVFIKNEGVIAKKVEIKKYKAHENKIKQNNIDKVKRKISKQFQKQKQEILPKSQKVIRKKSIEAKLKQDKQIQMEKLKQKNKNFKVLYDLKLKERCKSIQQVQSSLQKIKQQIQQCSKKFQKKLQKLPSIKKIEQKSLIKEESKSDIKQKSFRSKIEVQKPNQKNESVQNKKQSVDKKRKLSKKQDQPDNSISNPNKKEVKPRPNIPISPYKKQKQQIKNQTEEENKQRNKSKTENDPDSNYQQIQMDIKEEWLQQQNIDYSLTKTGKFHHQFDFLRKPPKIQQTLSSKDSDAEIEDYCRLTSNNGQGLSMIQTYKSKIEEVAQGLLEKYQPEMQAIPERTFEFGSDQFVRDPGNYQFKGA